MSVARHHADWLSLLEISGPFVSMPVLMRVFPQGLDPRDPEQARRLRLVYEEWQDNPSGPGKQRGWINHVLTHLLNFPADLITEGQSLPAGLSAAMPEYGETLRPDLALVGPKGTEAAGKPQLLLSIYPPYQSLDRPVAGKHWKATPATRMMELLHASDIPLGLLTNGEQWMLVFAPRGETTGFTSWYATLWIEEPITLRAFHSLLSINRFFGVAATETLSALLNESAQDQQEVTNQLGDQVRDAVEVLIRAFDRLDEGSGRTLLRGVEEKTLYDAALTVMMRLVFLFSAEERGLLHLGRPIYDNNYAVSTLREQLQEVADRYGEEVLERRFDAWARLLSSFRAVHGGVQHQDLLLPAYGGSLFDPDRYPFLEGRAQETDWRVTAAEPLAINNRVVLHLLKSLQMLQVRVAGGGPAEARRISFRALDIEQIGHIYEGLLDHSAFRSRDTVLGLVGTRKNSNPNITLDELERLAEQGEAKLFEELKELTGRGIPALKKALVTNVSEENDKILAACGQNESLAKRVTRFAELLREDSFERPVVVLQGGIYVSEGTARRSTGTHYTPRSLTEPIVLNTLESLIYQGPAEGLPKEQWELKLPRDILALKVCDMTLGSGAFLVQVCRYLSERLVESWENLETAHPGEILITPEGLFSKGKPSDRLIPTDLDERLAIARRLIADRCLYGVDINPMAVEMAKLSIWLITVDRNRPFTFLDHALKRGDSLLGVSSLEQVENFSLRSGPRQITFATANLFRYVEEASSKRRTLEDLPCNDKGQIEIKNQLHAEAEAATAKVRAMADLLIDLELRGLYGDAYDAARDAAAAQVQSLLKLDAEPGLKSAVANHESALCGAAREQLHGRRPFHWPLEFPEVFARGGFDAFVGNPPFLGGGRISSVLGDEYLRWLLDTNPQAYRSVDLCAYFFLRAFHLLNNNGALGLIGTNTLAEGDTRKAGLDWLLAQGSSIQRADHIRWPGLAVVEVVRIILNRAVWGGSRVLDGEAVEAISANLSVERVMTGRRLLNNAKLCFEGSKIHGEGFILSPREAEQIINSSPDEAKVIKKFLGGKDFTSSPTCSASRYVICFEGMEKEEAEHFPLCFALVVERVKPHRETIKSAYHAQRFWRYWTERPELYQQLKPLAKAIAASRVGKYLSFAFVRSDIVLSDSLVVFPTESTSLLAILQSSLHAQWAYVHGSTLRTDFRYTYSTCFESFPLPASSSLLLKIGEGYGSHRNQVMLSREEGLPDTYNRFHDRSDTSENIERLRALHVEMDYAVAAAYGWSDLDLGHDFHDAKERLRFTLSESARRIVLDRLLSLNQQRYEEEVKAGHYHKMVKPNSGIGGQRKKNSRAASTQDALFVAEDSE